MIDYGVKAPSEQIILDNLVAAKLGAVTDDGFMPTPGVSYVFLGQITKTEAVFDGEELVTPAVLTEDVHADLRFDGPDETALVNALKARTTIAGRQQPDADGAPVTEGRADGFQIYPHAALASPAHEFWGE